MGAKSSVGGRGKKGRQHVVHQRKYQTQFTRTAKNKERDRDKHLAKHPNDLQAKEQIKKARNK